MKSAGAVYCSFDDLLMQADFIVALTPLSANSQYVRTRPVCKNEADCLFRERGARRIVDTRHYMKHYGSCYSRRRGGRYDPEPIPPTILSSGCEYIDHAAHWDFDRRNA